LVRGLSFLGKKRDPEGEKRENLGEFADRPALIPELDERRFYLRNPRKKSTLKPRKKEKKKQMG